MFVRIIAEFLDSPFVCLEVVVDEPQAVVVAGVGLAGWREGLVTLVGRQSWRDRGSMIDKAVCKCALMLRDTVPVTKGMLELQAPVTKGMLELQAPTAKGMLELQAPTAKGMLELQDSTYYSGCAWEKSHPADQHMKPAPQSLH